MEAIILIGIQASGKSTFYLQRFFATHVRINLDMLRTRRRESILLAACIAAGQRFLVDNTNLTSELRRKYIEAARPNGFRVIGYYFVPEYGACLARNGEREGKACIPDVAIRKAMSNLEPPSYDEDFDELYEVRVDGKGGFHVKAVPQEQGKQ